MKCKVFIVTVLILLIGSTSVFAGTRRRSGGGGPGPQPAPPTQDFERNKITYSTYYPTPSGIYDRIRLVPREPLACTPSDTGLAYYDINKKTLFVCASGGNLFSLESLWEHAADAAGDLIYLKDLSSLSNLRLSFATTTPSVSGDLDWIHSNHTMDNAFSGILSTGIPDPLSVLPNYSTNGLLKSRLVWFAPQATFGVGQAGSLEATQSYATVDLGRNNTASGDYSATIGNQATALNNYSIAIGSTVWVAGDPAIGIGGLDTNAIGNKSIAIGARNEAKGNQSIVLGPYTQADGDKAIAIGSDDISAPERPLMGSTAPQAASHTNSIAIGKAAASYNTRAIAIGYKSLAQGVDSIALAGAQADGQSSIAIAGGSYAKGSPSIAMSGGWADKPYSIAIGEQTLAFGNNSIALGHHIKVHGEDSIGINISSNYTDLVHLNEPNTMAIVGGRVFIGTSSYYSYTLNPDPTSDPTYHLTISDGLSNTTTGFISEGALDAGPVYNIDDGTQFYWYPRKAAIRAGRSFNNSWQDANVGYYSAAFNYGTTASGDYTLAVGDRTTASGNYSFSAGSLTQVTADYAMAFGRETIASGVHSMAFGRNVQVSGDHSIAIALGDMAGFDVTANNVFTVLGGNVGINVAAPQYALDVNGDVNVDGSYINVSGGVCSSDRSMKESIIPIQGSLEKLARLQPVEYKYRDKKYGTGIQTGLVAQDVEDVFPEWISETKDGHKAVRYGMQMEMHMIQALKELKDNLDSKIESIEKDQSDFRTELKAIRSRLH